MTTSKCPEGANMADAVSDQSDAIQRTMPGIVKLASKVRAEDPLREHVAWSPRISRAAKTLSTGTETEIVWTDRMTFSAWP
jgi:hypothetical protein